MIRVIGIGDNVCDKYRHLNRMFPGGQALNFAVYCKKKGNDAAYLGVFGNDPVADHLKKTLSELKIDFSHSRYFPGGNGYAVVDLKGGERVFITSNKGGVLREHPLVLNEQDLSYVSQFDLIHTSNNSYIDPELPKLSRLDNLLSYDFSKTWKGEERTRNTCRWIDFGFLSCSGISEEEVRAQLKKICDWGCGVSVATMGSRGAAAFDGSDYYSVKPKPVEPVDTLGAGDSFAAGFLMRYVEDISLKKMERGTAEYRRRMAMALREAADLSAETCMRQGAFGCGTELV